MTVLFFIDLWFFFYLFWILVLSHRSSIKWANCPCFQVWPSLSAVWAHACSSPIISIMPSDTLPWPIQHWGPDCSDEEAGHFLSGGGGNWKVRSDTKPHKKVCVSGSNGFIFHATLQVFCGWFTVPGKEVGWADRGTQYTAELWRHTILWKWHVSCGLRSRQHLTDLRFDIQVDAIQLNIKYSARMWLVASHNTNSKLYFFMWYCRFVRGWFSPYHRRRKLVTPLITMQVLCKASGWD